MNPHLPLITNLDAQRKALKQQERDLIKSEVQSLFNQYPFIKSLYFLSWNGAPSHNFLITAINNFNLSHPYLGNTWLAQTLFERTSGDEFKSFLVETKMKVEDFRNCFEALFLIRDIVGENDSRLLLKIIKEVLPESKLFVDNGTKEVDL